MSDDVTLDEASVMAALRNEIDRIVARNSEDTKSLGDDDLIPDSGLLDSAALIEFVVWYEGAYNLTLKPEEITLENLGSLRLMARFALEGQAR